MEAEVGVLKFRAGLQVVEEVEKAAAPGGQDILVLPEPEQLEIRSELSTLPPAYVVIRRGGRLMRALRDAVEKVHSGIAVEGNRSRNRYLQLARLHGLLHPDEEPVIQELLVLRNQALHSGDPAITSTDALRYYDFAEALISNFKERAERVKE
jgi:hypothetical protein